MKFVSKRCKSEKYSIVTKDEILSEYDIMHFIYRKELQFNVIYESLENVIERFYKMSYMILKCKGDVIAA